MEEYKFAFQVLQFLLTGSIGIYVYLSNRDKVTNDRITKIEEANHARFLRLEEAFDIRLGGYAERLAKSEAHWGSSVRHSDLASIYEKINKVDADIRSLSGEFSGVRHLLNTIHHHLLESK